MFGSKLFLNKNAEAAEPKTNKSVVKIKRSTYYGNSPRILKYKSKYFASVVIREAITVVCFCGMVAFLQKSK